VRAAHSAGISAGILAPDRDRALECVEAGFTFLAIASDSALLAAAAREAAFPIGVRTEVVANR
jgi:2-keto-3-deoxy-L-rhamnonate aldolase RhmA